MIAISFDADQTLWDFADVHRRSLAAAIEFIEECGDATPGQITAAALQAARERIIEPLRGGIHDLALVREQSFALVLRELGHPAPERAAAAVIERYMAVRFDTIRLYDDVLPVLTALRGKYPLGLLTNGNTDPERCGLPGRFDAVIMGPEHGLRKPEPAAFETIADALGVSTEDLWHVGDGADDIDGAKAVGATAVFIDRDGTQPPHGLRADHRVTSLRELARALPPLV